VKEQEELNLRPTARPLRALDDGSYPRGFFDWVESNWPIYLRFVALAKRAKRANLRRWSADAICHVLRWETALRERSDSGFKINNNRTAGLARLAMALEPDLKGFFVVRTRA
jgi:hypothetical protein